MTRMKRIAEITGRIQNKSRLAGGDINETFLLNAEKGDFVIKTNSEKYTGMFKSEKAGLEKLSAAGLPVPEVFAADEDYILMRYYKPGRAAPAAAGEALGRMHALKVSAFGLDHDNYIGTLPQRNTETADWVTFYRDHRLKPQVGMLSENSRIDGRAVSVFEKLYEKLPEILQHDVKPSLLHGDLWGGNLHWSDEGPVFIDPAVYAGDALVELAFTELFGGFSPAFYDAYRSECEINPAYNDLKRLYQLYPLLVHANLFGGSYISSAVNTARHYI